MYFSPFLLPIRRSVMTRLLYLVLLLALVTAPGALVAQVSGSIPQLTLEQCLEIALSKNLDLRQANATAQATAAGLTAAFGAYLPGANLSMAYNRQLTNLQPQFSFLNGIPILGEPLPNTYTMFASANWTIFNGFNREASYDRAKANVDAADLDLKAQRLQTALDVHRRFVDVLRAMQVVRTRQENFDLGIVSLKRVEAQYEAGRVPLTSLYSQQAEVANQEFEVVRSMNEADQAKARLLAVMGMDPNTAVDVLESSLPSDITTTDTQDFRAALGSEDDCIARAMAVRPDVLATDVRIRGAEASVTGARSGYLPTVTATGGYAWRNTEVANFDRQGQMSVGFDIRVPLFDQFQTNANIENARLGVIQRQIERQRLDQSIRQSVQSSLLALTAAERQIDISQRGIAAADLSYKAAYERFTVGAATLVDVQIANNQLITARINRITAIYAYLDAKFQAQFASGLGLTR